MIICSNKKIKSFIKKILKNTILPTQKHIQSLMPSCEDIHCKCPKCKAKANFSYHGSYTRNISFICDTGVLEFKVTVTRVICNSCGSTHALLPRFIVPYKIYSFESILYTVSYAYSTSVLKTAEKLNLSFQLIYSFIFTFVSFFNHADSLNREKHTYNNFNQAYFFLNCLDICNESFYSEFFKRYMWIFLMTKFRNKKPPPITIGINFIAST